MGEPIEARGVSVGTAKAAGYVLYDTLGIVATLLGAILLPLAWLMRRGPEMRERLGAIPDAAARLHHPLWIHAASVGEVLAAEPLLRALRRERPDQAIVVSTTSMTGREMARARLAADAVMLLPADIGWLIDGVVRRLRPACLIVLETELWPALLRSVARCAPCLLVSGRVTPRAARRYTLIPQLTRSMLSHFSALAMQTAEDAQRIITLGAPAERVHVFGNLKFARDGGDPRRRDPARSIPDVGDRPVLLAASTHAGEERLALDACAPLWNTHANLLLIIAPRRPERFDEIGTLLEQSKVAYERRTRVTTAVARATRVLLLDTIGELLDFLPFARSVFVGGTMVPVGGHNVLEPALFGKPVVFGPQTANVTTAAALLLDAGAAVRIGDAGDLERAWRMALDDPKAAAEMGERGRAVVESQADVAERTLAMIRPYLESAVAPT